MDNLFLRRQFQIPHSLAPDAIDCFIQILRKECPMERGQRWIDEGDSIKKAYVIADGWAIRYRLLNNFARYWSLGRS